MASEKTIKQITALLSAAYPDHWNKLSVEQVSQLLTLYSRLLADIDDALLEQATLRHIARSQWFPKVSELRNAAVDLAHPPALDPVEAWGQVCEAIRRVGVYSQQPSFDDPMTGAIVRQMGWRELCLSEFPIADRARFLEAYERQTARAARSAQLPTALQDGSASVNQIIAAVTDQLAAGGRDATH